MPLVGPPGVWDRRVELASQLQVYGFVRQRFAGGSAGVLTQLDQTHAELGGDEGTEQGSS